MPEKVQVVIVGSGTAGLSALREVRRTTDDFLIVNDGDWGTTCAARGCMPSKSLIEIANAYHRRGSFEAFGIEGGEGLSIDVPAALARVRRLRDGFAKGPRSVPDDLGERAIAGRARLLGPHRLAVGRREIEADRIILAPGSRPVVPGAWERFGDRILTTDTLFEQDDLPRRIAVVGLGAIGVEMAQALSRLGVDVAAFDVVEQIAGLTDPKVVPALRGALERELPVYLGSPAELSDGEAGRIVVRSEAGSFTADAVLAALGRRPNIDDLGLETLGVPLDERGLPPVDPTTLQVGDLPVWLVGDANGRLAILHESADEGHIAGKNAVSEQIRSYCRRTPLAVVFSSPGVARVGAPWEDLDPASTAVGSADFGRQARARTAERAEGVLRIYADKVSGKLKGSEMCVPDAEHLAHLLALAIHRKLTVHELLGMPFYHPVLEEGLRSALRDLSGRIEGSAAERDDLAECGEPGLRVPA